MTKRRFYPLIAVFFITLFFNALNSSAQEQEEDLSKYFQDDGLQAAKNILKVDLMHFLHGDFHLMWEHRFNGTIATEIGIGNVSNKGWRGRIPEAVTGIPAHNINYSKISYSLGLKFYALEDTAEGLFYGINHRRRSYLGADLSDLYLTSGYQYIFNKKFIFAAALGLGVRWKQPNTDPNVIEQEIRPYAPLHLQFGIIL